MGASGGPNIISDGLVFALDAADPQTSKAGCMGFASAEQLMKNLATNSGKGDTITSTSDLRLGNLAFYTIYSQTYPEGDYNPAGASGTRDGITPGFNDVTSSELLDFSRDLNYAVWNNKTNGWVADSYFNGERKAGHCYDTYDGEPSQHAQFQSDYEAIVNAFPDATHIVCGSHAAENNDSDSDTLAILKDLGGPSSWPGDRAEYILIGKPGLGAGNAYVWQYQNDATERAHANVGLPILGGKNSGENYLNFDGTDDYLSIPQFDFTSTHSLEWWFNTDNLTEKYSGGYAGHMLAWGYAPSERIYLKTDGGLGIYMHDSSSGATFNTSNFSVTAGNWTHIVVTFNWDAESVKCYQNGVLKDTIDTSSLGSWNYTGASNSYDYIDFGRNVSNNNIFYDGKLACIRIYDKILTDTQIKANFNAHRRRFGV